MVAKYSRNEPSPRYRRLLEQYRLMHTNGDARLGIPPERMFPGQSLLPQARHIRNMVRATSSASILDYGSGKGRQYDLRRIVDDEGVDHPDVRSYWGVKEIRCYDPAYEPFAKFPSGEFDGVICTDVLEHCPEEDLPWILHELFAFARKFVFANVACFPARKTLPSGGNAHCTIRPVKWWSEHIERAAMRKPQLLFQFRLAYVKARQVQERVVERMDSNSVSHSAA